MKPQAYLLLAIGVVAFLAANTFAWQPGIGGRRDRTPGTELERYVGWPAVWRAELWDSADPALASRILSQAPFYWPAGEMHLRHCYTGVTAVAVNVGLLVCWCGLVVLYNLPAAPLGIRFGLGAAFVIGLLACALLAETVSVAL